jgi:hypothetical protein
MNVGKNYVNGEKNRKINYLWSLWNGATCEELAIQESIFDISDIQCEATKAAAKTFAPVRIKMKAQARNGLSCTMSVTQITIHVAKDNANICQHCKSMFVQKSSLRRPKVQIKSSLIILQMTTPKSFQRLQDQYYAPPNNPNIGKQRKLISQQEFQKVFFNY